MKRRTVTPVSASSRSLDRSACSAGGRVWPGPSISTAEPCVGPVRVDLGAGDVDVRIGFVSPASTTSRRNARSSPLLSPALPASHSSIASSSRASLCAAVGPCHRLARGRDAEPPPERRLVDDVRQLLGDQRVREVDQRPLDRRDLDAAMRRSRHAGRGARTGAPPRRGSFATTARGSRSAPGSARPSRARRPRVGPAPRPRPRRRRRRGLGLARERSRAERVDPEMAARQRAALGASADAVVRQPRSQQLRRPDQPVLDLRERSMARSTGGRDDDSPRR